MRNFQTTLPIDDALPRLTAALAVNNAAVLVAPPGAGKTTRVPLVLLDEPWAKDKKILVLEPRRLAARAAASRMASTLGEHVGDTVGLRVRFGSKISKRTRIEVITEGVFTRLVLDDPSLEGVAAVLFDEFHERSLDADLGLALARDVQLALREDLKILVMSATLDGARVAALLGNAPVVESEGRAFPVETRYLGRDPRAPIERQVADAVQRALARRDRLAAGVPAGRRRNPPHRNAAQGAHRRTPTSISSTLFGALDAREQDRAISPAPAGRRKVVLATSIAETSLTIEGVRVVIDSGLSRVPRYEPDVGLTRLETVRVSRAAADQRRGRAGRTEPGVCYRLWDEPQTGSLGALHAAGNPVGRSVVLRARSGAMGRQPIRASWRSSIRRRRLRSARPRRCSPSLAPSTRRAASPRKAASCARCRCRRGWRAWWSMPAAEGAGAQAAAIAAVLTERGLGGDDPDLRHRLDQFRRDRSRRAEDARAMVKRWVCGG